MNERTDERETIRWRDDPAASNGAFSHVSEQDLERLLELRHHDPHSILGAHPLDGGAVVRAFLPDAQEVLLLVEGHPPREMHPRPEPGLFEISVPESGPETFRHRFEIHYPDGNNVTVRRPYSFPPTLGELDLHLWSEHKHERIWDKMGAHPREVDGVQGTAFALWAPNAEGVSVVGDFNRWDGRLHMMRLLGSSGVWEVFVPELEPGTFYKYEIAPTTAATYSKRSFATYRVPSASASRVYGRAIPSTMTPGCPPALLATLSRVR